ncbi:MAG: ADP-ribosylglycohydrolase family protein [Planctomycetota bacterium]
MSLPSDYAERVYAGVLGKIIGVYVGRPVEQWSHERIVETVGEVSYYVHEQLGKPLVVPDDDISGTFTFLRALPDHGNSLDITPRQIGETWLNYIVENRTILWWGGLGTSTEHTAFLRMKHGIMPPASGSAETNSRVVAEQIGAQIFIDGWGMVSPGDPEQAADLARRAGSVSHDGEAIHGAQVVAALVAQGFVSDHMDSMLDTAVGLIPADSTIAGMISDVREWHAKDGDWRRTLERIRDTYGYEQFGGGCHIVPNHALIVLSLLYAPDDFQQALAICCTSGYDTDCNVGNVGCILGVKLGLAGIDAGPDYRGPVADRLFLPCADGGRVVTDAAREADAVVAIGRGLAGEPGEAPKGGARYHFEYPGSVQGFLPEDSPECRGVVSLENVAGHSGRGSRSLAVRYEGLACGRAARARAATFLGPDRIETRGGYGLMASPALCPGQTVEARVELGDDASGPVDAALYVRFYAGPENELELRRGPAERLAPGESAAFEWKLESTEGAPIAQVGVEALSERRADGTLYLDYLDWHGPPDVVLRRAANGTDAWKRAWVDAVDRTGYGKHRRTYQLIQNEGRGILIRGCREWTGYRATCEVTPHMADEAGLAAHVQGRRRYYAVLLRRGGAAHLVEVVEGEEAVLTSAEVEWEFDQTHDLAIEVGGGRVTGRIDGRHEMTAESDVLASGAVGLVCAEGRCSFGPVNVRPIAEE